MSPQMDDIRKLLREALDDYKKIRATDYDRYCAMSLSVEDLDAALVEEPDGQEAVVIAEVVKNLEPHEHEGVVFGAIVRWLYNPCPEGYALYDCHPAPLPDLASIQAAAEREGYVCVPAPPAARKFAEDNNFAVTKDWVDGWDSCRGYIYSIAAASPHQGKEKG